MGCHVSRVGAQHRCVSQHHILMKCVQLALMEVALCRCLMDDRAVQSGHSHISGKKQHWFKIHSVEQHPPPDLADGVRAQPRQKPPAHSSSRCTALLPKVLGSFQQRDTRTTRWWGEKIKDKLNRKVTLPNTGLALSRGSELRGRGSLLKTKLQQLGLCRVQMSSTPLRSDCKPSVSAASPRDNTGQE